MTQAGGIAAQARGAALLRLGAAMLPATMLATPALAQSASDFRLPGATTTQAPANAQGPVDPDNPVVRQPVARPTAAATPTPTPTASEAAAAPTPAPSSARAGSASASRAARPAAAIPAAPPTAVPPEAATPAASLPTLPAETADQPPLAQPTEASTTPGTPDTGEVAAYWPWIAGVLALVAGLFAALWWRSRMQRPVRIAFEPPVVTAPEAAPVPAPAAPAPLPEPQLSIPAAPASLGIVLEARRMTASLVATTLSYTIRLTNHGAEPLATLAVEGDMISAHASLPPEQQIASDSHPLELRHAAVTLAPGESIEFTGDFRLPLAAVTPIRAGEAAYFVPLARVRVEGSTASGGNLLLAQTFVVGEVPEDPAAALRPFRLDLGPRTFTRIGQRAVG